MRRLLNALDRGNEVLPRWFLSRPISRVDLGLQREWPVVGDGEGGFEQLAVAGATGLGAGDDHLDRVPVAVLVTLERLVGADPSVVADLELVREGLVPPSNPGPGTPSRERRASMANGRSP